MNNNNVILWVIVSLVVGIVGGYYYGNSVGVEIGKQQVLDQQKLEEEAKIKEVQDAANPFSEIEETANPFKDTYQNPFE